MPLDRTHFPGHYRPSPAWNTTYEQKLRTFSLSLSPERDERIYQAVKLYSYTPKQVAEAMGLSYSRVSVIAKKIAGAKKKVKK